MTWTQEQNTIPPYWYRLLAASKSISLADIIQRSGLGRSTVIRMSRRKNWNGTTVLNMELFIHGCGYELGKVKEARDDMRRIVSQGVQKIRSFKTSKSTPLWKRGSIANQLRSIARTVAS
jgi:hypothetical protein